MNRARARYQGRGRAGHSTLPPSPAKIPSKRRVGAGFTLLEVLVAMSLLSLILLLLFTALHSGGRHWHAGAVKTAANDERRLTRAFIRKQFEQAAPLLQISASANRVLFYGAADSVLYTSYLPAQHAGAGMYVLRILAQDRRLMLQYLGLHEKIDARHPPPLDETNARALLENITAIRFQYYGRHHGDEPPDWRERWTRGDALPELVRIEIEHETGGPWPAMIVPIHSQALRDQPQLAIKAGE